MNYSTNKNQFNFDRMIFDPNKKAENVDFRFDPVEMFDKIVFDSSKKATSVDSNFDPSSLFGSTLQESVQISSSVRKVRNSINVRSKDPLVENEKEPNWLKRMAIISAIMIPTFGAVGYKAAEYLVNPDNSIPQTKVLKIENNSSPNINIGSFPLPDNLPFTNKDFLRREANSRSSYKIKDDKGRFVEIMLSKANGNKGKYIDDKGAEYFLGENTDGTSSVLNKQELTSLNNVIEITPTKGRMLIAAPYANVEKSIRELQVQGYEVDGIDGGGAIRRATPEEIAEHNAGKNDFVTANRYNPEKYYTGSGETYFRSPDGTQKFTSNLENNRLHDHDGFYTTNKGETRLINLKNKSAQEKIKLLLSLRNNHDIISYHVGGWIMDNNVANKTPQIGQARSFMVFDKDGKYISSMFTPAIGPNDIITIAQKKYGKNCIVLNRDGDFYAKFFKLDTMEGDAGAYFLNNTILIVRKMQAPSLHILNPDFANKVAADQSKAHDEDFRKDVLTNLRYDPLGLLQKSYARLLDKVNNKGM
jgi:hypothetical protein